MALPSKRATIYLDADLHRALRLKSAETSMSISEVVNDAVREALAEDMEDLQAFERRKKEPVLTFEAFLKELKRHGKL